MQSSLTDPPPPPRAVSMAEPNQSQVISHGCCERVGCLLAWQSPFLHEWHTNLCPQTAQHDKIQLPPGIPKKHVLLNLIPPLNS